MDDKEKQIFLAINQCKESQDFQNLALFLNNYRDKLSLKILEPEDDLLQAEDEPKREQD